MIWRVEFTKRADKQLSKLAHEVQQDVVSYLEHVVTSGDPRNFGKPLVGDLSGFWRYRVGKFRIICDLIDERLIVEVIEVGKRETIYG